MAARRITASSVDWAEFAKKIPQAQKPAFAALKNKQDNYVRKIASLPESLPKIDFAIYKARVSAAMVEDFQKKYEALKVPYPKDTLTATIESQAVEQKAEYEKFVAQSKTRIQGINEELAKWNAMMPIEEMNCEEALTYVPHLNLVVNPDKPSLWPHDQDYDEWRKRIENMEENHH